jgi:predicted enzyme related to lactoylglutathione lyase
MGEHTMKPGTIGWIDLTVDDAPRVRDFYSEVVGWKSEPVQMDGYDDYTMVSPDDSEPRAGVCHARGANAELPSTWLMYINVTDLDESLRKCTELGGSILAGPRSMGQSRYCIIRDPAGAHCALYEPGD